MSQKIEIRPSDDGCGLACPVIVCDACGERIVDAKHGNTMWRETRMSRNREQFIAIFHTHKRCTWDFMHRRFPEPADASWMWMSHGLEHDLFLLLRNVNFDRAAAKRQADVLAGLTI
jgi:hypothetical protein